MKEKVSALSSLNINERPEGLGKRFAIVASRWNISFINKLVDGAMRALSDHHVTLADVEVFFVPGAFELPLACKKVAETGRFDAVIAIGVVVRGGTPHFEYVAGEAARGISSVSLNTGIPVMFGVITADNIEQVAERSGDNNDNKGYEAAAAAVETVVLFERLAAKSGKIEDKAFPHVV